MHVLFLQIFNPSPTVLNGIKELGLFQSISFSFEELFQLWNGSPGFFKKFFNPILLGFSDSFSTNQQIQSTGLFHQFDFTTRAQPPFFFGRLFLWAPFSVFAPWGFLVGRQELHFP